ncbi:MAG: SRPBCC domain-containing protein [Chloroflexi bacterium]|nr:SRPBCC domain-containing protein [Chloroflexota bacterium]
MEFAGTVTVKQPRTKVWDFLLTPELVTRCVPNLGRWEATAAQMFTAEFIFRWGEKSVLFNSELSWLDLETASRAQMHVIGHSAHSSFHATTHMALTEIFSDMTQIQWAVQAGMAGKLAEFPAPFLKTAALIGINKFFNNVKQALE